MTNERQELARKCLDSGKVEAPANWIMHYMGYWFFNEDTLAEPRRDFTPNELEVIAWRCMKGMQSNDDRLGLDRMDTDDGTVWAIYNIADMPETDWETDPETAVFKAFLEGEGVRDGE